MFGTTSSDRRDVSNKAWLRLGEYLDRPQTRLLRPASREAFRSEWQDICDQEAALDDAILIGLVGGTGVGKSTFINALAGESISRSSDRRPTTSRVVVYRNLETELPPDVPTKHLSQPQVLHEKADLKKVIVFDFPDFDSAERSHAGILAEYLPHLDIVFIVADDIKYGDRRLYDLLASLSHDKANLYVLLNKVDRLQTRYGDQSGRVVEEIHEDMRDKLKQYANIELQREQQFSVAAKVVADCRIAGTPEPDVGSLEEIERLLNSFQREKHRRAVKERNLDARKAALVDAIEGQALGAENRDIIEDARNLVEKWRAETELASAAIPVEILLERERRGLRTARMRRASAHWGFPTSLILTLFSEFRRWRGAVSGDGPSNITARIHQHYRAFFESLANLKARIQSEVAGTALAAGSNNGPAGEKAAAISAEALTSRLGNELESRLAATDQRPSWMRRTLCHVPAMLVLGFAVWSRIYPLLDSMTGNSESGFFATFFSLLWKTLSPSFLLGLICSVVLAYLASAIFVWLREIQVLEARIADGERDVREQIRVYGDEVIGAIDLRVQSLHEEFEQLRKVIQ